MELNEPHLGWAMLAHARETAVQLYTAQISASVELYTNQSRDGCSHWRIAAKAQPLNGMREATRRALEGDFQARWMDHEHRAAHERPAKLQVAGIAEGLEALQSVRLQPSRGRTSGADGKGRSCEQERVSQAKVHRSS